MSLRVAVVGVVITVIFFFFFFFFAVAFVFLLLVFFLVWLLAKEDIGSYRLIRKVRFGAFQMYCGHGQMLRLGE